MNKGHGLAINTAIAKTVHYLTQGDDTYAVKHQHFIAEKDWKILTKDGKRILFKISSNRNIYLAPAHPLYKEGGDNYVDQLSTSDEIKVGTETKDKDGFDGIFENNNGQLYVPGSAIGFTKYEEDMDSHAKHPMQ